MEDWIPTLRWLVAAGLALLLIMLRLEAFRFSAAEYDDAVDGQAPSFRRRIAWYGIGLALVTAIYIVHPSPQSDFAIGPGDRRQIGFGFDFKVGAPEVTEGVIPCFPSHANRSIDVFLKDFIRGVVLMTALVINVLLAGRAPRDKSG